MGYAPVSTILTPPTPADSGTTLSVQDDSGDRFPSPSFTALIFPVQTIPTLGVDSEEVEVVSIDHDDFTITRADDPISITSGLQIAALSTVPVSEEGGSITLRHTFPDDEAPYMLRVRSPQGHPGTYVAADGVSDDGNGAVQYTFAPSGAGLWHGRWESDVDIASEFEFFVKFSDVVD